MPACPDGALPKPGFAGLQVWLDKSQLALDILSVIERLSKLSLVSLAAELVDVNELCASNPEPIEPITAEDVVAQTFAFPTGGVWGHQAVIEKAIKWLRYQQFLLSCDCIGAPPPSGGMCPYVNAGISLGPGAASPAVAYDIPQSVYDLWPVTGTLPSQDWKPVYQLGYSSHTPSSTQRFLEWSADGTTWSIYAELPTSSSATAVCQAGATFIPSPRMPRTGQTRVRNNTAASLTLTGFNFCFCQLSSTPPPIPPQDPLTPIPTPPAHVCDDQSICDAINELSHRITIIAKQITEVQRFGIPFAYIRGPAHVGMSGTSSFGVSRLIGMEVDITSHTPTKPDLEGNPPYVWDQGWMSIATGDGMIEEKRISQTHLVWMPRLMDLAVTFGFELRPGTVATFTELQPEP